MDEILGCHYGLKSVKFTEFVDHSAQASKRGKEIGQLDGKIDWNSHASKNNVTLKLRISVAALPAQQVVLRVVMKAEYTVLGGETQPEYGDLIGLPREVWLAIGRHAWSLFEEKIRAQLTPIASINIPPPTDAQIAPPESFGGFSLN